MMPIRVSILQDIFEIMTKMEIQFGKPKLLLFDRLLWILFLP